jgi:hypothetical protein
MHKQKRMEERLRYISSEFQNWLEQLLNSNEIDFFLLHKLNQIQDLVSPFTIEIRDAPLSRKIPIKKSQGYLLFEKGNVDLIANDFLHFGLYCIHEKKYTPKGIVNYLILVDRLGSLTDDKQYQITKDLCLAIPLIQYEKIVLELIIIFNKEYLFDNVDKTFLSCKDWEDLFLSTQYLEHFDNPIDLLRQAINFRISEIPLIEIIHKLAPDPRAALLEYGINLDYLKEIDVLDYLNKNESECTFYGALIVDEYNHKPSFLGKKLASFLIKEKWVLVGGFLFNKIYNKSRRRMNEETKEVLVKEIDGLFLHEFSNRTERTIFANFVWPSDFLSLGGWLNHIKEVEINISFSQTFISELSTSVSALFLNIKNSIPDFIAEKQKAYNFYNDPFDLNVLHINTYLMWATMLSQDREWNQIKKAFKTLCYEIKKLYYGSYTANHLALTLSNNLLCLLLTYPAFEEQKLIGEERLIELIKSYSDIIGYQWIHFAEQDDLIWDYENHKPNYSDANLLYILKRLKEHPTEYQNITDILKTKIKEVSTTLWPVS